MEHQAVANMLMQGSSINWRRYAEAHHGGTAPHLQVLGMYELFVGHRSDVPFSGIHLEAPAKGCFTTCYKSGVNETCRILS